MSEEEERKKERKKKKKKKKKVRNWSRSCKKICCECYLCFQWQSPPCVAGSWRQRWLVSATRESESAFPRQPHPSSHRSNDQRWQPSVHPQLHTHTQENMLSQKETRERRRKEKGEISCQTKKTPLKRNPFVLSLFILDSFFNMLVLRFKKKQEVSTIVHGGTGDRPCNSEAHGGFGDKRKEAHFLSPLKIGFLKIMN